MISAAAAAAAGARGSSVLERFRLDDRVAVVTGASSGLGAGFAAASGYITGSTLAVDGGMSGH